MFYILWDDDAARVARRRGGGTEELKSYHVSPCRRAPSAAPPLCSLAVHSSPCQLPAARSPDESPCVGFPWSATGDESIVFKKATT
jgi:hypothetical protein